MKRVAFLFDNDGVLIDSIALHWESWQHLMREEPDVQMSHTFFTGTFGKRNDRILHELAPEIAPSRRKSLAETKEALFRQLARERITLIPGMERFLKEVKKENIPRIIASSTPLANLQMFLEETVLGHYFDQVVSADQVPHGKPAPDVFEAAAAKLGFAPEECVVFEDAPVGITAGKAAGCFVVALATTHSPETLTDYDLLYPSPHELDLSAIKKSFFAWKKE